MIPSCLKPFFFGFIFKICQTPELIILFLALLQTLKGATIFASDLVRAIHPVPDGLELGFVRASSYGAGTKSSGKVVLGISTLKDEDIQGRHILLVSIVLLILYLLNNGNTKACDDGHFMLSPAASVANNERRRAGTFGCPLATSG